ncbi:MAG: AmmeMemoRadiSam system protein A [Candidatus Woesearchaeota archaeon]
MKTKQKKLKINIKRKHSKLFNLKNYKDEIVEFLLIIGTILLGIYLILNFREENYQLLRTETAIYAKFESSFFPSGFEKIKSKIETTKKMLPKLECKGDLFGIIVPHAGYDFSLKTALYGLELLKSCSNFNKIVILYPNHYTNERKIAGLNASKYVFSDFYVNLDNNYFSILNISETDNYNDHTFEVLLPLIEYYFPNISVVGISVGSNDYETFKKVLEHFENDSVFIISSDFIHYGNNYGYTINNFNIEKLNNLHYEIFKAIENKDLVGFENKAINVCGKEIISLMMKYFEQNKYYTYKAELLNYSTSYDVLKDNNIVGYASFSIYRVTKMNDENKKLLLKLARQSIEYYLQNKKIMKYITEDQSLNEKRGVFVTLTEHGLLRGCIGYIEPIKPIYQAVIENAVNAAFYDPRFEPLQKDELDEIEIEVSLLTKPKPLFYENSEDLLNKLNNKMGLVIEYNGRSATFLPQVWEQLPDKELFLGELCRKAGLSYDCWKKNKIKVYVYYDEAFKESDFKLR